MLESSSLYHVKTQPYWHPHLRSQPPNLREINFYYLRHSIYGNLLWKPKLTNTKGALKWAPKTTAEDENENNNGMVTSH